MSYIDNICPIYLSYLCPVFFTHCFILFVHDFHIFHILFILLFMYLSYVVPNVSIHFSYFSYIVLLVSYIVPASFLHCSIHVSCICHTCVLPCSYIFLHVSHLVHAFVSMYFKQNIVHILFMHYFLHFSIMFLHLSYLCPTVFLHFSYVFLVFQICLIISAALSWHYLSITQAYV